MSKKTFFIKLFGVMAILILLITTASYADQYYDQYPGNGFLPRYDFQCYTRGSFSAYINMEESLQAGTVYSCPVHFNVPNGSVHFIKSIGIRYLDNVTNGRIDVYLRRQNIYNGAIHEVASWTGGSIEGASSSDQTAFQGANAGYKLINTNKFVYYLVIRFFVAYLANPGADLKLYQVRIHYGT